MHIYVDADACPVIGIVERIAKSHNIAVTLLCDTNHYLTSDYSEVVFCGFGEPTEALDVLKQSAKLIKEKYNMLIRINTNGLGNLVNGRDIVPELKGLVDTVSVSLNTPNADEYHRLVRSKFGEKSFDAMIDFTKECTKYIPNVVMTTVETTITHEEEKQCQEICDRIGAKYRIRPWED